MHFAWLRQRTLCPSLTLRTSARPKIVLNVATATLAAILEPFPRHANASNFSPKIIFRIGSYHRQIFR